ncbi:MAG: hypothetical protein KBD26_00760 [Candidatus Pacebacteria bacterium]|nr:hypothetical protein [Candidatus Paceibacterota bacterium]MBP9772341.1 hypothetical protein [Candidatus Paceibacterota bacterium]
MNKIIILFLAFICLLSESVKSQNSISCPTFLKSEKSGLSPWQKYTVKTGLVFIAGASDGVSQTLAFHYEYFQNDFPDAPQNYWNPDSSWYNKWANGDPNQGEAFPGSSTMFVWTTDGYHLFRTISKTSLVSGICFGTVVNVYDQKKWWIYLTDFVLYSVAYSAGFHLTYTLMFGKPTE